MPETTMEILVAYLRRHCGEVIASHNVEIDVPRYGEQFHLQRHNGGTYSRKFRELRESLALQQAFGLSFKEVTAYEGKEKQWNIISNTQNDPPQDEMRFVF